jgi:5-methylcytosine-specific restriction endonuclease McrA
MKISDAELIDAYTELKSTYKVASKFNTTRHEVKKRLKCLGVLRTQQQAAAERKSAPPVYKRTKEHRENLSNLAKQKTGEKNPFFGKKHKKETKDKLSEYAKKRTKERNPNYKDGKYVRRPRDYKISEFQPLRNFVFNRDKHTCHYCKIKGGHLHAHHILPYWICNAAFLDSENLITVCSNCHFIKAHKGSWLKFDLQLITDRLIKKYNIRHERLNELASLWEEAIVRTTDINETVEMNRNVSSVD